MDTFEITIALFFVVAALFTGAAVWHTKRMQKRDEKVLAERMQRERERVAAQLAAIPKRGPAIRPVASQSAASHGPARSFTPPPQPDYLAQHLMWQNINSTPSAPAYDPPSRASSYSSSGSDSYFSGSSSWSSCSSSDSGSSSSSDSGCSSSCD